MMEAARTSETSVDNHFTRQYNPEDSSEQISICLAAKRDEIAGKEPGLKQKGNKTDGCGRDKETFILKSLFNSSKNRILKTCSI
jgi:hypothetical protein